jgi:hypothetical protein
VQIFDPQLNELMNAEVTYTKQQLHFDEGEQHSSLLRKQCFSFVYDF